MKHTVLTLALLLLIGTISLAQQPQNPPVATPPIATPEPSTRTTTTAETSGAVVDQLKQLEQDWAKASLAKDADRVRQIEAADYKFVMPDGKMRGRDEDLAALAKTTYSENNVMDLDVRVYGDTAVVTGIAQIKGSEAGKDISGSYRFTDVWVKRDGNWQAVNTTAAKLQQP